MNVLSLKCRYDHHNLRLELRSIYLTVTYFSSRSNIILFSQIPAPSVFRPVSQQRGGVGSVSIAWPAGTVRGTQHTAAPRPAWRHAEDLTSSL